MSRLAGSAKLLRAINSSATLAHLLQAGQLTRAELRERTGLSKPTSSEMLRLLTDAGLAVVTGRTAGGLGPTAEIYAPNADAAYVVAVSIRDTTEEDRPDLAIALCDLSGTMRGRAEDGVDYTAISPADVVSRAVDGACRRAGIDPRRVRHIQIGVPGSYDPRTDTIHYVDVPGWASPGVLSEIHSSLAATLDLPDGMATVALENDVNLAAMAERHRGVAVGADSFALLWLGYGLGLATDLGGGVLLRGAHGGAGEIGYLPVCAESHAGVPSGRPAETGPAETGPTETGPDGFRAQPASDLQHLIGGPAIVRLAAGCGITASTGGEAVAAAISLGVDRFFDLLAQRIAFALATVVAVLDPPLVVLAGEVAQAGGARLRDAVVAAMQPAAPHAFPAVQVAVTAVADDAVLLGGLDAGLDALRESLISSLAQPSLD